MRTLAGACCRLGLFIMLCVSNSRFLTAVSRIKKYFMANSTVKWNSRTVNPENWWSSVSKYRSKPLKKWNEKLTFFTIFYNFLTCFQFLAKIFSKSSEVNSFFIRNKFIRAEDDSHSCASYVTTYHAIQHVVVKIFKINTSLNSSQVYCPFLIKLRSSQVTYIGSC